MLQALLLLEYIYSISTYGNCSSNQSGRSLTVSLVTDVYTRIVRFAPRGSCSKLLTCYQHIIA